MVEHYAIGFDIGTGSTGFAGVDPNGKLVRMRGKNVYGVYRFKGGEAAADRRGFRTTRRRIKRRKWRLRFLKSFFEPYIAPIDPEFFLRQKYSADSPLDPKGIRADKGLLSDMSDQEFHAKYPTIYHLRYQLMHEKRQFDVREIYLAMHHIIKYRGHFLIEDGADNFDAKQIDFFDQFQRMAAVTAGLPELETLVVPDETQSDAFKCVLFDESQTKSDRQKVLASQLLDIQDNQSKAIKDFIAALTKAVVGMKANLATLTSTAIESTDKNDWTKPLGQLDDFLLKHEEDLDEDGYALIDAANQMYSAAVLAALVPEGMGFSEAMMARYAQHKKQLALYKQVIASLPDKTQRHELKDAYADYIEHAAQNPRDAFYKRVTKVLEGVDSADARTVMTAISHDEFLLKQRTLSNGKIPYQMQQHEFDAIIENQKAYYPWLATPNPVEADAKRLPYYLDELIGFRVPYYVGPMVTEKQSQFAWMIRKADGELTPWNFFDVVDREKTANRFIQRMQTTDKYILGEDVLPKHSILYQQFEVLNELNNIRVEKHPLTTEQKQFIYQRLFVDQQRKTITKKNLQDTLVAMGEFDKAPDIGGLAKEDVMMSSLATFADYSKILPEAISDPTRQNDIEDIIAWSTIFEDTQIFFDKLKTVDWLTTQQRKRLASIRYTGWGKLSKRLLQQIPTSKHTNVMAALWATSDNFMQILQDEQFQEGLYHANRLPEETLTPDEQVEKILDEAYLSPADKKGARKVIKVMNDIVRANHGVLPEQVFLESADDPQKNKRRSVSRSKQLEEKYRQAAQSFIDEAVKEELNAQIVNSAEFNDRLVLYFTQNGRDMYTGKRLDIENLGSYQIDHILPQSLVKDDSLDNRALTARDINAEMSNQFVSERFGLGPRAFWQQLKNNGLISGRKFRNLVMQRDEIDKYAPGFINRQLVETRQIIKTVEQIIHRLWPDIQIVTIKANLTHQVRSELGFPKVRELNDYHHAFDALLAARIGQYLLEHYAGLKPFFTYGEFKRGDTKKYGTTNFLRRLTKDNKDKKGELLPEVSDWIDSIDSIYNYKKIPVVWENTTNMSALFDQTIYPRPDRDTTKRKLIPTKLDKPTDIYGGYSSAKTAYMAVMRVQTKKGTEYPVFNIPVSIASQLNRITDQTMLKQQVKQFIINAEQSASKKKLYESGDVILSRVALGQRFTDKNYGEVFLISNMEVQNPQSLWLGRASQQRLTREPEGNEKPETSLADIYQQILKQVDRYFLAFNIRQQRQKLLGTLDQFTSLPVGRVNEQTRTDQNQRSIIARVMIVLGKGSREEKFPEFGLSALGRLVRTGGITLSEDAQIIYQSPTGLFERRVALKDL